MLFNVFSRFFHRKTAGTGKPGKKQEMATTLIKINDNQSIKSKNRLPLLFTVHSFHFYIKPSKFR
jgi:hypothetical protein